MEEGGAGSLCAGFGYLRSLVGRTIEVFVMFRARTEPCHHPLPILVVSVSEELGQGSREDVGYGYL
jgi:hypothetical protein